MVPPGVLHGQLSGLVPAGLDEALRAATVITTMIFEPMYQCLVQGLIMSAVVQFLFSWSPLVFFMVNSLVWFLLDWILICVIQQGPLPFSKFEFLIGWILNECTYFSFAVRALWNPVVTRRGRHYKMRWGGVTDEVTPPAAPPESPEKS